MQIKIKNKIYDSNEEPIMLIFKSDKERLEVIKHLTSMKPKRGIRKYVQAPAGMPMEKMQKFALLEPNDKKEVYPIDGKIRFKSPLLKAKKK
jgi:hypothetical protein